MLTNFKNLKKLPVETESGQVLGHINDCDIELDSHAVNKYSVSPMNLFSLGPTTLISPDQIIAIKSDKIIVSDALVKQEKETKNNPLEEKTAISVNAEVEN